MATSLSRKLAMLLVAEKVSVEEVVEALTVHNLLALLPALTKDVKQISKDESFNDTILIESPFEINEEAVARIKRIIGNDLAPHEVTLNKKLLAGFKARFKGKLYDGSAERIIKQFTSTN